MLRFILLALLLLLIARAFWRLMDGVMDAAGGTTRSRRRKAASVQLVRDPVCGTFVVPADALSISQPGGQVYFCSTRCRDQYRARIA